MKGIFSNSFSKWMKKSRKALIFLFGIMALSFIVGIALFIGIKENKEKNHKQETFIVTKLKSEAKRIDRLDKVKVSALDEIYQDSLSINELKLNKVNPEFIYQITNDEILKSQDTEAKIKIISKSNPNKLEIAERQISAEIFNEATIKEQENNLKAVHNEVARINGLPVFDIKTDNKIEENSLKVVHLDLHEKQKTNLKYLVFNDDIFENGPTHATIFVSLNGIVAKAERKINISGLNTSLADKRIITEANRIKDLTRLSITKTNEIQTSSLTLNDLDLGSLDISIAYKIIDKNISQSGDGNIEIEISLKKSTKTLKITAKRRINANIINTTHLSPEQKDFIEKAISTPKVIASGLKDLNDEKNRINNLPPLQKNETQPIPGNTWKLDDLVLDPLKFDESQYEVFHSDINSDGYYNVTIAIKQNGVSTYAERKIKVSGINNTKNSQKISKAKDHIEKLNRLKITQMDKIDKDYFNVTNLQLGSLNDDINYEIKKEDITKSGDKDIEIAISLKSGITFNVIAKRKINANIINTTHLSPKQKDLVKEGVTGDFQRMTNDFQILNTEISRIQGLAPLTINRENPIPGNTLKENDLDLKTLVPGAEYKFFHPNINNDESVYVDVFITLNDFTVVAKREIDVVGITAHKADQKDEENRKIKALENEVKRIEGISSLDFATNDLYLGKNFFNETNLVIQKLLPWADYTFQNAAIDHDGKYIIFITISFKQGNFAIFNTALIEVNVTGIDAAIVKDKLEKEVKRINDIPRLEIKTVDDVLVDSLKAIDIQLDPKLPHANYEITNALINVNREYEVDIKITLDGQMQEAKRKIKVTFREWKHIEDSPGLQSRRDSISLSFGSFLKDSKGNIWIIGYDSKLLLSKDQGNTFEEVKIADEPIDGGRDCTIFEDSNHRIWIMGGFVQLQFSDDFGNNWIESNVQAKNPGWFDGFYSTIFEDSQNNLWVMGRKVPLQVLRNGTNTWEVVNSGIDSSNSENNIIFEDSHHTLWAVSEYSKLRLSHDWGKTWQDSLSGISTGYKGTIFEDSKGILWTIGYSDKLFISKDGGNSWLDSKSGITHDVGLRIFEDENSIIWILCSEGLYKLEK